MCIYIYIYVFNSVLVSIGCLVEAIISHRQSTIELHALLGLACIILLERHLKCNAPNWKHETDDHNFSVNMTSMICKLYMH